MRGLGGGGGGSGLGSIEKRSYLLSQNIAVLSDQIKLAQEEYMAIAARNRSELSRLGLEREADFRRMMAQFAATQASLVQASADIWASMARQFSAAVPPPPTSGTNSVVTSGGGAAGAAPDV